MSQLVPVNLMNDMSKILENNVVERHSYFQMKYFIIHKEPTIQAKLWQCLREIKSRYEALESLALEIDDGKDNLELISINIEKYTKKIDNFIENNEISKRELEIELRKLARKKIAAEKNIQKLLQKRRSIEEEGRFFVDTYKNLIEIEPLKPYDDFDSQCQYWGQRLNNKLELKILTKGNLDLDLMETILALPDNIPVKQNTLKSLEFATKKINEINKENHG